MPITRENILRHELIGLEVRVVESTDRSLIGLEGRVIDETMQTLKIRKQDGKEVVVPKRNCKFVFTLPTNRKVMVDGRLIYGRPADRIKKKIPKRVWGEVL